jgi:hypothetical protein
MRASPARGAPVPRNSNMSVESLTFFFTLVVGVVVAAGMLCIFAGARRIAGSGFERIGALLMAVGIILAVGKAGADLYVASGLRRLLDAFPTVASAEPPGGWEEADMMPEQRTTKSTENARLTYQVTGRLVTYIDATGQRATFAPTQADLHTRERLVVGFDRTDAESRARASEGWRQLMGALTCLVAGWLLGLRARRRGGTTPAR